MFNQYKSIVLGMADEIFKISVSGEGYLQTVLNTMLVIAFTAIALMGTAGVTIMPIAIYYLLVHKLKDELFDTKRILSRGMGMEGELITEQSDIREEFKLRKDKLEKKIRIRTAGFITGMVIIYVPIVLPIILIVGDIVVGVGIPAGAYFFGLLAVSSSILTFIFRNVKSDRGITVWCILAAIAVISTLCTIMKFGNVIVNIKYMV